MLKSLSKLFKSADPKTTPSDHDLKLAAATLMYEMIRSDGLIDEVELHHMRSILKQEFDLQIDDLYTLLDAAKESSQEAISLQGFTREICESWDNSKRIKMIEYLWKLALADEHIDPHERHLVRKIAGLLYINEREIQVARTAAINALGIELGA